MNDNYFKNEALNRARQMQTPYNKGSSSKPQSKENKQPLKNISAVKEKEEAKPENIPGKKNELSEKPKDLIELILNDKEKSLIILIIILLTEENADKSLILALMYLII